MCSTNTTMSAPFVYLSGYKAECKCTCVYCSLAAREASIPKDYLVGLIICCLLLLCFISTLCIYICKFCSHIGLKFHRKLLCSSLLLSTLPYLRPSRKRSVHYTRAASLRKSPTFLFYTFPLLCNYDGAMEMEEVIKLRPYFIAKLYMYAVL